MCLEGDGDDDDDDDDNRVGGVVLSLVVVEICTFSTQNDVSEQS